MYKLVITCMPYGDVNASFETIIKEQYIDNMQTTRKYLKIIKKLNFENVKIYVYKYDNNKYINIGDFTNYDSKPIELEKTKKINKIVLILLLTFLPFIGVLVYLGNEKKK